MIRQRRFAIVGLAAAMVAVVSVLVAGSAWAMGPLLTSDRVTVSPGEPVVQFGNADARARQQRLVPSNPTFGSQQNFGPSYPFGYNYTGPSYPFGRNYTGPSYPFGNQSVPARSAPVFAAPSPRAPRWVHGYWGQQWMPQYYTYDAWIPGYFAQNGAWIQGRYETQTAESGGWYERVWVEGYWTE